MHYFKSANYYSKALVSPLLIVAARGNLLLTCAILDRWLADQHFYANVSQVSTESASVAPRNDSASVVDFDLINSQGSFLF